LSDGSKLSGRFVKIGYAEDKHLYLNKSDANRPMGRYNRPGQDALYLSTSVEAALGALRNMPSDPTNAKS